MNQLIKYRSLVQHIQCTTLHFQVIEKKKRKDHPLPYCLCMYKAQYNFIKVENII